MAGRVALAIGVIALILASGCQVSPFGFFDDTAAGVNRDGESVAGGEPDDQFNQARMLVFDSNEAATITGSIAPSSDVDVFDLGPIEAGDRITVDVTSDGFGLDAVVAIFDDAGRLVAENDDRNLARGQLDPLLDVTARRSGDSFLLAIAAISGTGGYSMDVQIVRGDVVPLPAAQTVFLDFTGGSITLSGRGLQTVPPFDAAAIDPSLADQTQVLKDALIDTVMENFDGFDVVILNSDDDAPPPAGTFSRVLLGGFSPRAFGASGAVDSFNADPDDVAVIYIEVFSPDIFRSPVDAQEVGLAIGNVTAHEIGHLLGLNHVADPTALMDTVGGPDTLLFDQDFDLAPLDVTIFPIGFQDGALLLAETIGVIP